MTKPDKPTVYVQFIATPEVLLANRDRLQQEVVNAAGIVDDGYIANSEVGEEEMLAMHQALTALDAAETEMGWKL